VCQEPADRGQPLAPGLDQALQLCLLHFEQFVFSKIPFRQDRSAEQLMPTLDHLPPRPGIGQRLIHMHHDMAVLCGHNRVAADLYDEDLSQLQQAPLDPAAPALDRKTLIVGRTSATHSPIINDLPDALRTETTRSDPFSPEQRTEEETTTIRCGGAPWPCAFTRCS